MAILTSLLNRLTSYSFKEGSAVNNETDRDIAPDADAAQSSPTEPGHSPSESEESAEKGTLREAPSRSESDTTVERTLEREFRTVEKWQIGINVALAVIGIIALYIYHGQLSCYAGSARTDGQPVPGTAKVRQCCKRQCGLCQGRLGELRTIFQATGTSVSLGQRIQHDRLGELRCPREKSCLRRCPRGE